VDVNPLTRLVRRLGRYEWLMKLAPVIIRLDGVLHKVSRGRLSLVRLAGLPSLRLVTVGRKSGLSRANDLLYTPYGDAYVVIGSGWGRPRHPAWTLNLMAEPNATVVVRGRPVPVVARQVTGGAELIAIWELALRNWPAYVMERRISGNREFRVFVLTERDQ
jgi:deazaflavin-dependent oxidoreductase (nitroreductase family)